MTVQAYTVFVVAPCRFMNANERHSHWSQRSGPTGLWREEAGDAAAYAEVPALERARITAVVHRTDRRFDCDSHNRYPTVKAAVDGLVDAGVLPDDCDRHLVSLTIRAGEQVAKREFPYGVLELIITEEGSLMPWFMTDDKLHSHKKAIRATAAGVAPMGLWVLAGSWSADQLTDGFIPEYIATRIDPRGWAVNAAALVKAGLWVADEVDGEPGWRFHEWEERQPTRSKVEEKREAAKERMERLRASRKDGSRGVRANNERTNSEHDAKFAESSQCVRSTPALPNPALPTLKESGGDKRPPRKRGQRLPEDFAVSEEMREWARRETPNVGQSEHDKFCDYFRSAPGQKGVKVDWVATWRNWMRRAQESAPSNVVAIRGNDRMAEKHAMLQRSMERARALDALDEMEGRA